MTLKAPAFGAASGIRARSYLWRSRGYAIPDLNSAVCPTGAVYSEASSVLRWSQVRQTVGERGRRLR